MMITMNKILWVTDGSEVSMAALNYAKFFAKAFDSEIIGLHVIEVVHKKVFFLVGDRVDLKGWVQDSASKWVVIFDGIQEELKREELKFTYKVISGVPDEEIIRIANEEKVDLIVMGKRGLGLIDRVLIGSTTLKVLKESPIPVLAVKKMDEEDTVDIHTILVPLDIFDKADSALNYAIELAGKINAKISVIYIFQIINGYTYEFAPNILKELLMQSANELRKKVEKIKSKKEINGKGITHLEINTEVIYGLNTAVSIVEYASSKNIDLIVINTHGRKGIKKFILGSVTERVIQEAHCAVLTLKP